MSVKLVSAEEVAKEIKRVLDEEMFICLGEHLKPSQIDRTARQIQLLFNSNHSRLIAYLREKMPEVKNGLISFDTSVAYRNGWNDYIEAMERILKEVEGWA